jgi:predicted transcriptional regulator
MDVARFFIVNSHINYLPVVQDELIYGVIHRERIMTHIVKALEYYVETEQTLASIIDTEATVLPIETSIYDAISILANRKEDRNSEYFIISKSGKYMGCGDINKLLGKFLSSQEKLMQQKLHFMS